MSETPGDAIPAATLVLFRAGVVRPELLFVERSRAMVFAGGALVFPGGRVDPGDRALALELERELGGDGADIAARIAAIRETIEEVGVAIGLPPLPPDTLVALRAGLHRGAAIGAVLRDLDLSLDVRGLVPFARWCPAHAPTRIFDTRFYLAEVPEGMPDPVVDDSENVRVFWSTAQGVLDEADAGRAHILFPTRRNLERLARFDDFAAAVADAGTREMRIVTPWVEQRGGVPHLCIPGDLGYPVTAQPMDSAVRG